MPVLRMPGDDTLGSTLGSMADAWGQAYDPMARARAAQMGQQIQLSQFDLQKQKTLDAYNQNAATVFDNANPLNQDPASKAATVAAIRAGTYNAEQAVNATVGLTKLRANQATADLLNPGTPDTAGMTPAQIADARAQVLSGASLPTYQSQVAGATTDIAKSAATLNAANAVTNATPSNMPDVSHALAGAQVFSSPAEAQKIAAGGNLAAGATATSPADLANQRINTTLFTGQGVAAGTPVNQPNLTAVQNQEIAARAIQEMVASGLRARGINEVSAGVIINSNPAPGQSPVTVVPIGASPPTTLGPNETYYPPRNLDPQAVQTAAAAEASGKEGGEQTAKLATDTVNEAQAAGFRANELASKVARLREIMPYLNNQGPLQQFAGDLANKIQQEWGITIGPGQSARNVWNTMVNQLLPELKDDYGFQRVAAPEIALAQGGMPMGSLDAGAILRIVNALDATAEMNKQVAGLGAQARKASPGMAGITPQAYDQFLQGRAAIDPMAILNGVRQKYPETPLEPTTKTAPAPNNSAPSIRVNPTSGAVERLGPDGKWSPL
jgi:hypothetical protein